MHIDLMAIAEAAAAGWTVVRLCPTVADWLRMAGRARALLHLPIRGRVGVRVAGLSDGGGELVERCGDTESARGVEAEFVVAAAKVLHERVSGDDCLRGPVGP